MISFVNAKINIGLNITRKREDGYHDLSTIFYPVGLYNGTPANPEPFCDILEIVESAEEEFIFTGREIACAPDQNLVVKGYRLFYAALGENRPKKVILEKHLPDGAGMGGGSADASFVLRMLNELEGAPFSTAELEKMALRLGADCPVFIKNEPAYGEGVGEILERVEIPSLRGKWLLVVKPDIYISTKTAFAGVKPRRPEVNLMEIVCHTPIENWRGKVTNDFEESLFPKYPELAAIKESLYANGAKFALMSGSGSSLYGIFDDYGKSKEASTHIDTSFQTILKL